MLISYCEIPKFKTSQKFKVQGQQSLASTGIFTAPAAGVYFFTFFYHTGRKLDATLYLYKNDQRMAISSDHSAGSEGAHNGGNGVTLQLERGDEVYVYMAANTHAWGDSYGHTTFSGFLLQ